MKLYQLYAVMNAYECQTQSRDINLSWISVVNENCDGKKSTLHRVKRSSKKLITTTFNVLIAVIVFSFRESNLRPDITPQPPWIISLIGAGVTPFAYLEIGRAMIEQFQHVPDVLCILNHEVQFHVEFAAHQLQSETNKG